ncbi:MAG: hypothetical protein Q8Q00_10680 [Dehalococcoidia bacterium]|nr:hypothetical protein [Dehalococcoidia bacterium]
MLEAILVGVERLVFAAYGDPDRGGRWVRKAVVRGSLDGGGSWELPVPFREALANPRDAWFAVKCAIERRPPERPVEELVGLNGESGRQTTMFDGKGRLERQVLEAVRQLAHPAGADIDRKGGGGRAVVTDTGATGGPGRVRALNHLLRSNIAEHQP